MELPLFVHALQLVGKYVDLENGYCLYSIHMAIVKAEPMEVTTGVHISTMAEDVFFLLRDKCLDRATATLSSQAALAVC